MADALRVFAGDCTITTMGARENDLRGEVVVLLKPDNTVLVHDRDGYQPVAWLTRPDTLTYDGTSGGTFSLTATDDGSRLDITANDEYGLGRYPASRAGHPSEPAPTAMACSPTRTVP